MRDCVANVLSFDREHGSSGYGFIVFWCSCIITALFLVQENVQGMFLIFKMEHNRANTSLLQKNATKQSGSLIRNYFKLVLNFFQGLNFACQVTWNR